MPSKNNPENSKDSYTIASKAEWEQGKKYLEQAKRDHNGILPSGFKFKRKKDKDILKGLQVLKGIEHSFLYLRCRFGAEKLIAISKHFYLGKGNFGRVKVVEDVAGRRYALKILCGEIDENELKVLRELNYLYFVGQKLNSNQTYILMELFDGINLDDYLAIYGDSLTKEQKSSLAYQMADAINYLHKKDIVHGDLKPANFILQFSPKGIPKVKIIDFGCSRRITKKNPYFSSEKLNGTPFYSTLENKTSKVGTISKFTDMYAFGIILKEDLHLKNNFCFLDKQSPVSASKVKKLLVLAKNIPLPQEKLSERLMVRYRQANSFCAQDFYSKMVKEQILKHIQRLVRCTDNIDELLVFFKQLKLEEMNHPSLRKERCFLMGKAGMTDSWKEALLVFKVRAMELCKNEMNVNHVILNPEKYAPIFQESRARIFKCIKPEHLKEFEYMLAIPSF